MQEKSRLLRKENIKKPETYMVIHTNEVGTFRYITCLKTYELLKSIDAVKAAWPDMTFSDDDELYFPVIHCLVSQEPHYDFAKIWLKKYVENGCDKSLIDKVLNCIQIIC